MIFGQRRLSQQSLQIDALDGLRGLAVFIVFLSHTGNAGWHLFPGLDFRGTGKSGVFLFFVLSAFLLSRNLTKASGPFFTSSKAFTYWSRRFLRVYPLYILYVLVALTLYYVPWLDGSISHSMSVQSGFQHLMLLKGESVTWSIPVEFKYYIILPFVTWLLILGLQGHFPITMIGFFALCAVAVYIFPPSAALVNDIRTGPYLVIFLAGSLLGVAYARGVTPPKWFYTLSPIIFTLCILGFSLSTPSFYGWVTKQSIANSLAHTWFIYFALLWSVVLMVCLHGVSWIPRIFEFPPLRFLGQISFSFYLWHSLFIGLTQYFLPELASPLKAWVALIGSTLFSTVTFFGVERPMSSYGIRSESRA